MGKLEWNNIKFIWLHFNTYWSIQGWPEFWSTRLVPYIGTELITILWRRFLINIISDITYLPYQNKLASHRHPSERDRMLLVAKFVMDREQSTHPEVYILQLACHIVIALRFASHRPYHRGHILYCFIGPGFLNKFLIEDLIEPAQNSPLYSDKVIIYQQFGSICCTCHYR